MNASDLKIVIENKRGSYKKFADSVSEYPLLGVTMPTDYGFIESYTGEDGDDLDAFVGSGTLFGILRVNRDDVPGGVETKILLHVSEEEFETIKTAYAPVIREMSYIDESFLCIFLDAFQKK